MLINFFHQIVYFTIFNNWDGLISDHEIKRDRRTFCYNKVYFRYMSELYNNLFYIKSGKYFTFDDLSVYY